MDFARMDLEDDDYPMLEVAPPFEDIDRSSSESRARGEELNGSYAKIELAPAFEGTDYSSSMTRERVEEANKDY
eukprot:12934975-Alexandrium_andersonii.AAC.1